jgi:hypothetical protein
MDPDPDSDPDPAIFVIDLQDDNKKLFEGTIICIILKSKIKSQKEVKKP